MFGNAFRAATLVLLYTYKVSSFHAGLIGTPLSQRFDSLRLQSSMEQFVAPLQPPPPLAPPPAAPGAPDSPDTSFTAQPPPTPPPPGAEVAPAQPPTETATARPSSNEPVPLCYSHRLTGGTHVYFEGEVRMFDAFQRGIINGIGDDSFQVPPTAPGSPRQQYIKANMKPGQPFSMNW